MGNGILKTWLNLGEDVSISTCGTYHGDTIVHDENIEASKEGETRKLKGIWIHPRFLQVPPNQSWCFDDACIRLNIVLDVIEKHQMLHSITLTDIMNQGKIVVSGDRIAELRDLEKAKLSIPKVDSGGVNFLFKCYLPSLHLPKSEFLMERLTLVYVRCVNPSCVDEGDDVIDDDMLAGSFDGDEGGGFSEAVKEILANHKNNGYRMGNLSGR